MKLSAHHYRKLVAKVMARDNYQCRRCGATRGFLSCHHILKRSKLRLDTAKNLVLLCHVCHELVERHVIDIHGDANGELTFMDR